MLVRIAPLRSLIIAPELSNPIGATTILTRGEGSGAFVALESGVESNAPDAVRAAARHAPSNPDGIGIDAPLFWVDKGDRRADATIRKCVVAVGGNSGTVSSVNSLPGACVGQGILTARHGLYAVSCGTRRPYPTGATALNG
ncbi:MAG: DUF429 domain-containing protein [Burkholderiaceae bacterium]|nr:DUF429 domain-containing protein [Burkholderiaceae bacterium]